MRKHGPSKQSVINALKRFGRKTAMELLRSIGLPKFDSNIRARLTELHSDGKVVKFGKRTCGVTGRTAFVWGATK
jgi:predicted ArsR family transcriptional regulator